MPRLRRFATPALAAALLAAPLGAGLTAGRAAAAAPVTDSGPTQSVVLQLAPRDPALLAATARASGALAPALRLARLGSAVAGADRAAQVAALSWGLGLTVTARSDYAVTVAGSAGRIRALFGSARSTRPTARSAQPLPTLPGAYGDLVTVADGGDETRPALLPHLRTTTGAAPRAGAGPGGTLSVPQLRSLYGTAATTAPPAAAAPIVASLQLATWSTEHADVTGFARANALFPASYDPMTAISLVPVDGGCGPPTTDSIEVPLDQETLLAVAPQLRQRIYAAGNCTASQDLALDQAAQDVAAGAPIVAFTTSWGLCEPQSYASARQAQADLDAVDTATAAGITVFAAAGDNGADDCANQGGDAVDSPADVPDVVGVGGTTLQPDGTPTVWNDATGATGGGFSCGIFARPAYQDPVAVAPSYPQNGYGCPTGGSARQVPDLAADAGDGLEVFAGPSTAPVYGTSFSAPLAAGGYAQTLARAGRTRGLGTIGGLLYRQAGGGGFTDVTSGGIGDYTAGPGYDPVSGLGTPHWQTLLGNGTSMAAIGRSAAGLATVTLANGPYWTGATATVTTPLALGDPREWNVFLAPYQGDQANDLWAVHLTGTASRTVEIHILSQASGYQTYVAHLATGIGTVDPATWLARIGSFAGDGAADLFMIATRGTGSGRVEVHVLSQASQYRTFVAHDATALAAPTGGWTFLVGDRAGSGDLVGVSYAHTGSGRTEVHALSRASGYRTFTLHVATPLPYQPTDGSAQWSLRDVTADGVPDLARMMLTGTASGDVEIAALRGPGYTGYATTDVTALPALPAGSTVGLPQ